MTEVFELKVLKGEFSLLIKFYLQQMRPKFLHVSALLVPHVLEKLDDLLHAAEVVQDLPLDVVEVELKLFLIGAVEGDGHEPPGLLGHVDLEGNLLVRLTHFFDVTLGMTHLNL